MTILSLERSARKGGVLRLRAACGAHRTAGSKGLSIRKVTAYTFRMESERMDDHDALRAVATVRRRAAGRQRPLDWIGLWWAVFLGGYVTLFTVVLAADDPDIQVLNAIALPPIIIAGALLEGARARSGIRRQERAGFFVAMAIAVAVVLVAIGVTMFGEPPWWWPVVTGPLIGLLMGALPAARLLRSRGERTVWGAETLSRTGAVASVALAGFLGFSAAAGAFGHPVITMVVLTIVVLVAVASLVASSSRWGLESIGASWARRQWIGFALTVLVLYGGALPVTAASAHPLVAVAYGLAVAAPLALSALPRRDR